MPDAENIQRQLEQLHKDFSASLLQRIEKIKTHLDALETSPHMDEALKSVYQQIHSLSGSAGTFNYRRLGELCRQLELHLKDDMNGPGKPDNKSIEHLQKGLDQLKQLATAGPDNEHIPLPETIPSYTNPQLNEKQLLVYVVEDDDALGSEICLQLSHYGYQTCLFQNATQAKRAITEQRPDLLLLDMMLPEGTLGGAELANDIRLGYDPPPAIIFISIRDDWEARLAAMRAGGMAYIPKPVDFSFLLDQLDRLVHHPQWEPYRVLVVDDVAELAHHYTLALRQAGMQADMITRPEKLLDKLETLKPELILLDLYLPGVTGYEIAQVIRQHKNYFCIPIVFLSTEDSRDIQLSSLQEGDDFLQKPILNSHLVRAISTRVRRARILGRLMYHDSLTGLLNHVTLKLRLESELLRSQRLGSSLSYAMLDLDHFKQVNDRYGHPAGDQVLKSLARLLRERLRRTDQIGRYGGEEFGIIMPDTDTATAKLIIEQILKRFVLLIQQHEEQAFSCSFSAGIAGSRGISHHNSLIAAADQALYQAKEAGRNRVRVI